MAYRGATSASQAGHGQFALNKVMSQLAEKPAIASVVDGATGIVSAGHAGFNTGATPVEMPLAFSTGFVTCTKPAANWAAPVSRFPRACAVALPQQFQYEDGAVEGPVRTG